MGWKHTDSPIKKQIPGRAVSKEGDAEKNLLLLISLKFPVVNSLGNISPYLLSDP